jgi:hypothetical protein
MTDYWPADRDYSTIRRFISLFPEIPLAKFLATYFMIVGIPLEVKDGNDGISEPSNINDEAFFDLIVRDAHTSQV